MDGPGDLLLLGGPELMEPSDLGGAMVGAAVAAAGKEKKNKTLVMSNRIGMEVADMNLELLKLNESCQKPRNQPT